MFDGFFEANKDELRGYDDDGFARVFNSFANVCHEDSLRFARGGDVIFDIIVERDDVFSEIF